MTTSTNQIASGLQSLMYEYETIAHNLANSGTSGFKRRVNAFSAELQRQQRIGEEHSLLNGQINLQGSIDFSQGMLKRTDQPLDIALEGPGFIALETPEGPRYTRSGTLSINPLNQLVDGAGRLVAGQDGPIVIPPGTFVNEIYIEPDGSVRTDGVAFGQIQIVEFGDAVGDLIPIGYGSFQAAEQAEPMNAAQTRVRQGYQEHSNVQTMHELTNLISVTRLYEANINVLRKNRENSSALLDVAKTA